MTHIRKGWYYEPSKYCNGLFDVYYNGGLYAVIGENLAKKICNQ